MRLFCDGCVKFLGLIVTERASTVLWSCQALKALFRQGSMSMISCREMGKLNFSQQNLPLVIIALWPACDGGSSWSHSESHSGLTKEPIAPGSSAALIVQIEVS